MEKLPAKQTERFLAHTLGWTAALTVLLMAYKALGYGSVPASSLDLLRSLVDYGGLFLPFACFAGGVSLASSRKVRPGEMARAAGLGLPVAVVVFAFSWLVSPSLEVADTSLGRAEAGQSSEKVPETLGSLIREYRQPVADPADSAVDARRRANWIEYRVHAAITFPLFAIFEVVMGLMLAVGTFHLPAGPRRHLRWASGIALGVGFMRVMAICKIYARTDPDISGALMAWMPFALLGVLMTACWWLVRADHDGVGLSSLQDSGRE